MLEVQDTGTGMDADTAAQVFEPFFTTKGVGEGTGLGLSTVYGIVQQSSGFITVDSAPGGGTTFRIFLPRHERGTAPPEVVRERPTPRSARRRATVLLVEDDDGVRQLTQRVLEEYGFGVLGARSGAEALGLLDVGTPHVDVVVSDVVMPGMSGRELAGRLRLRSPDLPVLFLSGYTGDEVVDSGRENPQQAFLQKPYSPDVLVTSIDQLLEARPAAGGAPATAG